MNPTLKPITPSPHPSATNLPIPLPTHPATNPSTLLSVAR